MDTTFGILGTTVLRVDGNLDANWGKPRERAVLATLLAHAGRPVSIDTLLAWAWPRDTPVPQNPTKAFYTHVHRIRRSLQRMRSQPQLDSVRGGYRLDVDKTEIDYERFRALLAAARNEARQADPHRTIASIEEALGLWRGQPLADLASERADAWRRWFVHNSWLPANTVLVEALIQLEHFEEALDRLDDLARDHPPDLRLSILRLSTLNSLARFPDATAHYLDAYRYFDGEADTQSAMHLRAYYEELKARNQTGLRPQPRTPAPPRQLPHDINDFTGREHLLSALDEMTTTATGATAGGVVILDGMAGVGKTALVTRWGHRMRERFPDGDLFVNLNGFSEAARVEQSAVTDDFLLALGHEPNETMKGRTKELLLSRLLAGRRALVVLDNVRETSQVAGLVRLLSGCLVLVTSRQQLGKLAAETGARQLHVEPMTEREGTDLLRRRFAGHARLDPSDWVRVVELCGGLPLVITMLADRMTRVPEHELSAFGDRLDRRQLLDDLGQHGDGMANPRTFFSWSYLELAQPERRLFRLIALHPGPDIGVDAASASDGRSRAETVRSLNALVGAHLLEQPDSVDRYRLHDLLAEFARECAEIEEPPPNQRAADRRVLAFYLLSARAAIKALSPQPVPPPPEDLPEVTVARFDEPGLARAWFDRERGNLTAAVAFAAKHGYLMEAWQTADPLGTYLDRRGAYSASIEVRRIAAEAARALGDRLAEASTLIGLAKVRLETGSHAAARRDLATAQALFEGERYDRGVAACLVHLGRAEMLTGDPTAALKLFERCLAIVERSGDEEAQCWTHLRLGEAYRAIDAHDRALVNLIDAKALARKLGDDSASGAALTAIGLVLRDLGDLAGAAAHCEAALRFVEGVDLPVAGQVSIALSEIATARGDAAAAIEYAAQAVEACRRTSNVADEALARDALGDAHHADADLAAAVAEWRIAADLTSRLGNPTRSAHIQAKIDSVPAGAVHLPRSRSSENPHSGHGRVMR